MQISVQCMGVDNNLCSQTPLYNKSYLMNVKCWNYNCAFYYYYQIMEKNYTINKNTGEQIFVEMSKKHQF
jgi:hypothetical protein